MVSPAFPADANVVTRGINHGLEEQKQGENPFPKTAMGVVVVDLVLRTLAQIVYQFRNVALIIGRAIRCRNSTFKAQSSNLVEESDHFPELV